MNERHGRPWPTYLLGIAAIGAILAAVLVVGPPSQSSASVTRTVTAQRGVVASTVSGSGNIEAAKQLDLGFKTSGVVSHIFVSQGQHVVQGQLLAELDPESAEVTLEQSRATLKTAQASLAEEQETDGEGATGSGGTAGGGSGGARASASRVHPGGAAPGSRSGSRSELQSTSTTSTTSTSTLSAAARAANIASASAAVKSDSLAVQSDEEALANTKLYAPTTGTLVSLSGEVGETVSATGTTRASTSTSSESSDASSATGLAGAASSSRESSGGSGSTDASKSSFAVLSDLSSMQLVVPLSESEIGQVKDGQPATVSIEALEGRKVAAEVTAISMLPTSNSGVVSYDVTFQLDQLTEGLRPGMSATAEVVVKEAEGVNVPTSAITGGEVTVLRSGKLLRRSVVTGLAGNSTTIIVSGLAAGETVVLPATQTGSSTSSLLSRLGSKLGGLGGGATGGLGGGAFRGAGGGGFAARAFGG